MVKNRNSTRKPMAERQRSILDRILRRRPDPSDAEKISDLINGRNMTNLGLFRQYTEAYLKEHPEINHDMTLMCRQLAPTAQGLPLEIYVFTRDKVWVNYERIMADVFDHLLASMPFFHLEFFEFSATVLDQ